VQGGGGRDAVTVHFFPEIFGKSSQKSGIISQILAKLSQILGKLSQIQWNVFPHSVTVSQFIWEITFAPKVTVNPMAPYMSQTILLEGTDNVTFTASVYY
jgi:hypothetical protein